MTDDTAAIQKTVDYTYAQGGGYIVFPSGIYSVTSVNIKEGITYYGDGATIKMLAMQPKGTRPFNTQYVAYSGMVDSRPLVVRNLIFDGNSQNQGDYSLHKLEHSDLLFLMADGSKPGKLKAVVENCYFSKWGF